MPALTPLNATLTNRLTSVDSKQLTANLNPSESTLTKNRGWGGVMVNLPCSGGSLDPCFLPSGFCSMIIRLTRRYRLHTRMPRLRLSEERSLPCPYPSDFHCWLVHCS